MEEHGNVIENPAQAVRFRPVAAVGLALSDIKLAHTVFALPFAVLAAVLVRPRVAEGTDWGRFAGQLALIAACMFFARTWAMLVNRLADAHLDRGNPRTAGRVFAAGRLGLGQGWMIAIASAGMFWIAAGGFWVVFGNPWPTWLAPLALLWIGAYAYTKRFTALCHVFLGSALALSPMCAAIAVEPASVFGGEGESLLIALLLLSAFVMCWVAGFDVAYALADLEFDREAGLHSIPAKLGVRGALWASRVLHALAAVALVAFAVLAPALGLLTMLAASGVCALLIYEHLVLARRGVAGLPIAFFTVNGVISVSFGVLASIDAVFV